MAKKPAAKALTKGECTSSVKVSKGDHITDEAEISLSYSLESTIENARGTSGGMLVRISLPDGVVVKDYEGAKRMARVEAARILRAMASQVLKGG